VFPEKRQHVSIKAQRHESFVLARHRGVLCPEVVWELWDITVVNRPRLDLLMSFA